MFLFQGQKRFRKGYVQVDCGQFRVFTRLATVTVFSTPSGSGPLRLKFGLAKKHGRYDTFATFLDLTLQTLIVTAISVSGFP